MANKAKKNAPVKPKRKYTRHKLDKEIEKPLKGKDSSKSPLRVHGRVLLPAVEALVIPEGLELYAVSKDLPIPAGPRSSETFDKLLPLISNLKVGENIAVLTPEKDIAARINKDRQLGFIFRYAYTDASKKFVRIFRQK